MNDPICDVSCVIPAYETIDLLARCVASAVMQKDVRLEVIVSDDSASPAVRRFVAALAGAFPCLRYVAGPRSGNPVDNWNHGLDQARGAVCLMLHHDEFLLDTLYLRKALERLSDASVAAVMGRTRIMSLERPSRFSLVASLAGRLGRPLWVLPSFNWIGPTAAFVFRAGHRFNPDLVQVVDVDFYRRVLATGRLAVLDGAQVASLGHHGAQISARIDPRATARREIDQMALPGGGMGPWEHRFHRAVLSLRRWLG